MIFNSCCSMGVSSCMLIHKMSSRSVCLNLLLGVSALHYSTGRWVSEGFWTVASTHALHQPSIMHLGISIVSVWKFGS